MSCHTIQHDLSQCLDGRLPSGRRKVVMDHVAGCDTCSQFWTELQRAQELGLADSLHKLGAAVPGDSIQIACDGEVIHKARRQFLRGRNPGSWRLRPAPFTRWRAKGMELW